jgi:ATP-dependent RNA helicase DDX51/DBP6
VEGDKDMDIDPLALQTEIIGHMPPPSDPDPELQATLPSFPLPTVPEAPSKSVLAIQGLDPALLDAEIVNPAALSRVPCDGEDDGGTGLSEKTRKRLKDLGITELFAGLHYIYSFILELTVFCLAVQTTLLPFLLPANHLQRSLYLPYNPPRDVCVSAPTGSGKTLAYVLPIIEVINIANSLVYLSNRLPLRPL